MLCRSADFPRFLCDSRYVTGQCGIVQPFVLRNSPSHISKSAQTPRAVKVRARRDRRSMIEEEIQFTEQRPFFEPAIRSFALGIGTGILLELLHVTITLSNQMRTSATSLSVLLPQALQLNELDPLVFWDNAAAMAGFAASYGLEVAAIVAVLKQFPNDARQATRTIMQMPTLPKMLMPNLPNLRRAMYGLLSVCIPKPGVPALSSSAASVAPLAPATTPLTPKRSSLSSRPLPLPGPELQAPQTSTFREDPLLDRQPPAAGLPFPPLQGPSAPAPDSQPSLPPTSSVPSRGSGAPQAAPSPRAGLAPGAWDPAQQVPASLRRARELWERRGFLKNFWYCAAMSDQLGQDEPLEVTLLGRKVALFRDAEGKARCLDNICPHRGAPLAQGWIKDVTLADGLHSCIVCPYHGWAFDTEGKLREVPSALDQEHLPKRSLVPAYPVEEKGGFIWLFFSSGALPPEERPPIPFVPELEDPNWQAVYGELEFDAPHWSVFDNAIDMAHIHYLHGDSFGNQSKPEVMDMQMSRDTFSVSGSFRIYNKPVNALWEWTSRDDAVPVEVKAFLPSTSSIKISLGQGVQMITFVNTVPIDADRSINRFCLIRNFAGWQGFDTWARNAMFKILGEDKAMVEQLRPELVRAEVSLGADLPQVAFRQLRSEWAAMGYIVDPEALQGFEGLLDK